MGNPVTLLLVDVLMDDFEIIFFQGAQANFVKIYYGGTVPLPTLYIYGRE